MDSFSSFVLILKSWTYLRFVAWQSQQQNKNEDKFVNEFMLLLLLLLLILLLSF